MSSLTLKVLKSADDSPLTVHHIRFRKTEEVYKHSSDWDESEADKVSSEPGFKVIKVEQVHDDYKKAAFMLRELEYKIRGRSTTKKRLYHSTHPTNIDSILKNSLNWRRVSREKYGRGVSFSDSVWYCHQWSNGFYSNQALIVADVLMGVTSGTTSMDPSHDTTISSDKNVYVKYRDDEFLITHIIYYTGPEKTRRRFW